jgi:hypothetical protein
MAEDVPPLSHDDLTEEEREVLLRVAVILRPIQDTSRASSRPGRWRGEP